MIVDSLTVLRKEMLELVGDRHAFRGALLQTIVILFFLGVYLPLSRASLWTSPFLLAPVYFVLPTMLTAAIAAEAFAGERERRTLETLLSTPLTDRSLFCGKAGWAIFYSFSISIVALGCGLVTTRMAHGSLYQLVPIQSVLAAAAVALAAAVLTASTAVTISSKVPVSKSAQQITTLLSMVLSGVIAGVLKLRNVNSDWGGVYLCALVLIVVGAATLVAVAFGFRRDRLFDSR